MEKLRKALLLFSIFLLLTAVSSVAEAQMTRRRVNAPLISKDGESTMIKDYKRMAAIFWFGEVTERNNYVETRVGYDEGVFMLSSVVFDRQMYDRAQTESQITDWDALAYFFDLDGSRQKTKIDQRSFKLVIQSRAHGTQQNTFYQGDENGNWVKIEKETVFDTWDESKIALYKIYRGADYPDNIRGWRIEVYLPWTQIGLVGPPVAEGENVWKMALIAYDRDDQEGTIRGEPQYWPENNFEENNPSTWGEIKFLDKHFLNWSESGSQPGKGKESYRLDYQPLPYQPGTEQRIVIREDLNSEVVEDTCVGASEVLCSGDDDYNFGAGEDSWGGNTSSNYFHVQNQGDLADWPCFARIYLQFPLDKILANKVIIEAKLKLYHKFPSSGGDEGYYSLIQAFPVDNQLKSGVDWTEDNIAWNTGPLALENAAGVWGDRTGFEETGWDNLPEWEWNVSKTVADLKDRSEISLALYSADIAYHTGKHFATSEDFPDWGNPAQRPTLEITFAEPDTTCLFDYYPDRKRNGLDFEYLLLNWGFSGADEIKGLLNNWGGCD